MERIPTPENKEDKIEKLLGEPASYSLDQFSTEIREELEEEWYVVEMEARIGQDRDQALTMLKSVYGKVV